MAGCSEIVMSCLKLVCLISLVRCQGLDLPMHLVPLHARVQRDTNCYAMQRLVLLHITHIKAAGRAC